MRLGETVLTHSGTLRRRDATGRFTVSLDPGVGTFASLITILVYTSRLSLHVAVPIASSHASA
jgi:hypothetical protein